MTDLTTKTVSQLLAGFNNKEFSAVEVTNDYINNIKNNSNLNCYIETFDLTLEQAKADENIANNNARSLEGVPLGIKDLFCTNGVRTTSASKMLENFVPEYESTVTAKLWQQGALMLGKLNMDEFAMGSANTNSYFGSVINPIKANDGDRSYSRWLFRWL